MISAPCEFGHKINDDDSVAPASPRGALQMSALGQKQTFATQKGMSALPPKADMEREPKGHA
jgi:hypothetical protein